MAEKAYITPNVLKWARESARMSEEIACAKVSVSVEKLKEWEDGTSLPTIRQAQTLAKAYKRPFALLFLPEIPNAAYGPALHPSRCAPAIRPCRFQTPAPARWQAVARGWKASCRSRLRRGWAPCHAVPHRHRVAIPSCPLRLRPYSAQPFPSVP